MFHIAHVHALTDFTLPLVLAKERGSVNNTGQY